MPNLGATELIILLVVVMLLFGAKRLPDSARSIGRSMRILKAETKGLRDDSDTTVGPDTTVTAQPLPPGQPAYQPQPSYQAPPAQQAPGAYPTAPPAAPHPQGAGGEQPQPRP